MENATTYKIQKYNAYTEKKWKEYSHTHIFDVNKNGITRVNSLMQVSKYTPNKNWIRFLFLLSVLTKSM